MKKKAKRKELVMAIRSALSMLEHVEVDREFRRAWRASVKKIAEAIANESKPGAH